MKSQEGYTLIELLIVTAIISILAAAALPQFYPFKTRAYDADAKANLHNVFTSCKGYWTFNSSNNPCVLSTVLNNEYGFIQSAAVEVTLEGNNTESNFYASASHIWSANVYVIDYRGAITSSGSGSSSSGSSSSGSSGSGSSGSGSSGSGSSGSGSSGSGSKGKGCSEEAQSTENKGKDFGKGAKGGCA